MWITLTTDNVLALFNDSEVDAYNVAKGDAQGTDLGATLTLVVNELREAISGRDIALGPAGTIPDGFAKSVIGATRYEFLNAIPAGKKLLTEERVAANTAYTKLIAGIREGAIRVTPYDGLPAMALPAIQPRPRRMTMRQQEGV